MKVAVFTSLTGSYLPNGRILAKSVKKICPEWDMVLLFNDRTPEEVDWNEEPFDKVVFAEWLPINRPWHKWAFDYSVIEFCTATKGVMTEYLMDNFDYDLVIYMDPDTCLFTPLTEIIEMVEKKKADVFLTPHLTDAEDSEYSIWSHEMAALKHGTFNLGFFAYANTKNGRKALRWWSERLLDYSHIDFNRGLFTDQKWANLMPYMFEGVHVILDKAYNIATWNMTNRDISYSKDGKWMVNDQPVRFYHFSGFGHDFAWADSELSKLAAGKTDLKKLWDHYKKMYVDNSLQNMNVKWHWGVTNTGNEITAQMRELARNMDIINPYNHF